MQPFLNDPYTWNYVIHTVVLITVFDEHLLFRMVFIPGQYENIRSLCFTALVSSQYLKQSVCSLLLSQFTNRNLACLFALCHGILLYDLSGGAAWQNINSIFLYCNL